MGWPNSPAQPGAVRQAQPALLDKAPQIATAIGGFTELFGSAVSLQEELEGHAAPSNS